MVLKAIPAVVSFIALKNIFIEFTVEMRFYIKRVYVTKRATISIDS